ncbi:putative ribosomal biogenesis protein gar2 protein [Neofusicoccum parvum UCRNP2]|uniref:Putative ribosomal biogenesis protein gar2 protein n=1 Tax=Botryosphaeria parva (strain UCR-NP2) TaxID=1287680 RepID=R1EV36_BOTPV|nr:putative ribosomal biogenesis protein gar2 protein [Neofusicoccum parvum UCRNP2]
MAPETKSKKRKSGGAVSSPSTKKLKKAEAPVVEEQPAPAKPSKKSKKDVPKQDEETSAAKSKSSRKRASDFYDTADNDDEKPQEKPADKKSKKAKKEKVEEPAEEPAPAVKAAKGKKRKAVEESVPAEESADEEVSAADGAENESDAEDDQTAALLKGFESDEDEEDGEDEGDISKLPDMPQSKKLQKKLSKAKDDQGPGVIYIGRIPHGFYEHQMKAYFSQFGAINRLRLSRNKKTGRSKHYAFIEFAHADVAKIVADTMDKYLMFGHILQVRFIPAEQVHSDLFKGSNRRFKPAPRNKMQGRHLRLGMDREGWDKRIEREEKRRKTKEEKLKELGYDFEAPAIKSSSKVPKKEKVVSEAKEDAPKTLTDKPHDEEDQEVAEAMETVKAEKKSKKSKKRESNGVVVEEEVVKVKTTKKEKDAGKEKKPKAKKAKTAA